MNRDTEKGLGVTLMLLAIIMAAIVVIYNATVSVIQTPEGKIEGIRDSVVERIKPIGEINVAGGPTIEPVVVKEDRSGEVVFKAVCTACHSTGAAGAPIVGKNEQWTARLAKGIEGLFDSAKKGINAMPPKGTCADCSDNELKAAVQYMVDKSGGFPQAVKIAPIPVVDGEKVYNSVCVACHSTGAAGAPIVGKKDQWTARIAKGEEVLFNSAKNGLNAMPAKGTCVACSDADLKAAVDFMVSKSQ